MADLVRVRVWAEALIRMHLTPTPPTSQSTGGSAARSATGGAAQQPWTFDFDHAKRRAGLCNYTARRITVSRYLAAKFEDDEIHQVLLHEVAHALAGHAAGHGPTWQRIAADIGYVGGRTHDGEIAHERAPWVGRCPAGHEHFRFRRPTRAASCRACSAQFSRAHLISWQARDADSRT